MDITNPSIPNVLNMQGRELTFTEKGNIAAVPYSKYLKVMSVDFFLPSQDQPIIFDEKKKKNHMVQFLKSVEFGKCDYFVFDTPPTTSPELMTIFRLYDPKRLRIVLTTQSGNTASNSVQKSIQQLKATGIPIVGILCSMGGHTCPKCGHYDPIFPHPTSIAELAKKYQIPYLGEIQLGTVKETPERAWVFQGKNFEEIAERILNTPPVRFKPMQNKLSLFKKAMLVNSLDSSIKKQLKED